MAEVSVAPALVLDANGDPEPKTCLPILGLITPVSPEAALQGIILLNFHVMHLLTTRFFWLVFRFSYAC